MFLSWKFDQNKICNRKIISNRAQYAAAKQVRHTHEAPAILLAAAQSQSLAGKKDASFVLRKIDPKTGLTAAKARAAIVKPPEKEMTKIAPEEGLAFFAQQ